MKQVARRFARGAMLGGCALTSLLAGPAAALEADPLSRRIGEAGVAATLEEIEARAAAGEADASDRFAIGGLRFLRGIERSLQARWRLGIEPVSYAPVLRLPLPPNPAPEPFDAGAVETIFRGVRDDLEGAIAALDAIPDGAAASLKIDLADLWFDIDMNGERGGDAFSEDLSTVLAAAGLGDQRAAGAVAEGLVIAFDAADVAWLSAYAHLLSGVSELALSLESRAAIAASAPGWEAVERFGAAAYSQEMASIADQALPLILMLRGEPDPARTGAALAHFEATIAQNRRFWRLVDAETDDVAEWIPNPRQRSALGGATLSQEQVDAWALVLADAESLLKGELLVPHWRYGAERGETVGVNLRRVLETPASFDPMLWIQGAAAAPYLETGPLISDRSWRNFSRLIRGDAVAYAIWLN